MLQPIGVRPKDEEWRRFEPFVGGRRYYAAKELDLEEIPCYVRDVDDDKISSIVLEENVFRKDLEQPELLNAMLELREQGYTLEKIGEKAGKDVSQVSGYLRIPELPGEMKEEFFNGNFSLGHIKIMLGLNEDRRKELFDRIMEEDLSVDDARTIMKLMTGELNAPDFFDGSEFESRLGMEIDFRESNRGARLTIKAENVEELEGILRNLLK